MGAPDRLDLADVVELMPHTVKVRKRTGSDAYGAPTYLSGVQTYRALVRKVRSRQSQGDGREEVSRYRCVVAATTITPLDEVEFDGRRFEIADVSTISDERGVHHQVLDLS